MKLLKNAALLLLLTAIVHFSHAQVPAQYQAGYNQMMKTQGMQQHQLFFTRSQQSYLLRSRYLINPVHSFTVMFKDSTVLEVKSKINEDAHLKKNYLLYTNTKLPKTDNNRTRRIYCDETLTISRLIEPGRIVEGVATDSCWQFTVIRGAITVYSSLAEVDGIDINYMSAFKVGEGPVRPFEPEELEGVIKEDEKAFRAFKNKKYRKAVLIYNENRAQ